MIYVVNIILYANDMTFDLNDINNHCFLVTLELTERADVY